MNAQQLSDILESARTIAIIGAKDKPGQPVDKVGRYLIQVGYKVLPVHPKRKNVWGLETYTTLAEIPEAIDIVDVFRAQEHCLEHARESLALKPYPRLFWMQLGVSNKSAQSLLAEKGIVVVENACLMVEHAKLFG